MEGVNSYLDFGRFGFIYLEENISRLEKKLNVIQGEGNYTPLLIFLKENNPDSYKNLRKRIKFAYKKAKRESKYEKYN